MERKSWHVHPAVLNTNHLFIIIFYFFQKGKFLLQYFTKSQSESKWNVVFFSHLLMQRCMQTHVQNKNLPEDSLFSKKLFGLSYLLVVPLSLILDLDFVSQKFFLFLGWPMLLSIHWFPIKFKKTKQVVMKTIYTSIKLLCFFSNLY